MKKYSTIFFDLDGTLTDSAPGIQNGVAHALHRFGIDEKDRDSLLRFVGPPLQDSFRDFYGFSTEDAFLAVDYFREYYNAGGLYENSVYDGVEDALQMLLDGGKRLFVATSKPEATARRVLSHFGLDRYFIYIAGASEDGSLCRKADVVTYALRQAGCLEDRGGVLMVGDRWHDVSGARENGLDCLGAAYGYGGRRELEEAGAICCAESPRQAAELILGA